MPSTKTGISITYFYQSLNGRSIHLSEWFLFITSSILQLEFLYKEWPTAIVIIMSIIIVIITNWYSVIYPK